MATRIVKHFRGNVVAYVALFFALGMGTAYALDRNSVRSKHIVNSQVKSPDVKNDGLKGRDIKESSLGAVPDADALNGNDATQFLGAPVVVRTRTQPGLTSGSGAADPFAKCQDDERLVSGGWSETGGGAFSIAAGFGTNYVLKLDGPAVTFVDTNPPFDEMARAPAAGETPNAWKAGYTYTANANNPDVTVYAVCAPHRE